MGQSTVGWRDINGLARREVLDDKVKSPAACGTNRLAIAPNPIRKYPGSRVGKAWMCEGECGAYIPSGSWRIQEIKIEKDSVT